MDASAELRRFRPNGGWGILISIGGIKQALVPSGGITERAVKSGVWSGASNTATRVIQLLKLVILARLLPPADFGLIGIGFLVLAVFHHFSKLGIEAALIQHKESKVDKYLNTTWVLQASRGICIAAIAFLVAPYAGAFFEEPRAVDVIRVLALSPLIMGLRNPGVIYFEKDLQYHKQFVHLMSGTVVNFFVAVILGILYQNVWALVFGSLAGNLTSLVVSYLIHGFRPWPRFELDLARELINYGKWILGSTGLLFLIYQGDDIFVGWMLGATALGFYQMAFRFSNAPATEITQVVTNVAFPTYSKVQSDDVRLRAGFYRTVRLVTFISFPAATGIAAVAPVFVRTFLGTSWLPIIPVLQLLAIWGLLRSLGATMGPLFKAIGRPDIDAKIQAGRLLLILVLIYPATAQYGLIGTSAVIVLSGLLVDIPASTYLSVRIVDGSFLEFMRTLLYPAIGSLLMAGIVWGIQRSATSGIMIVDFVILVVVGALIYSLFIAIAVTLFNYRIRREFRTIYQSFV